MQRVTDLDVRMLEHDRRAAEANRHGWMRSSEPGAGRKLTVGAVLGAIGARLVPSASVRQGTGPHHRLDAAATETGARSLA